MNFLKSKPQTLCFIFNLKSDPERDATITIEYELYHGNPCDPGDSPECQINSAIDENGECVNLEEIQRAAEAAIWEEFVTEKDNYLFKRSRE